MKISLRNILLAISTLVIAGLACNLPGSTQEEPVSSNLPASTYVSSTAMPVGTGRYILTQTTTPSDEGALEESAIEMTLYYESGVADGGIEPELSVYLGSLPEVLMVTGQTEQFVGASLADFTYLLRIEIGIMDCTVNTEMQTFTCP